MFAVLRKASSFHILLGSNEQIYSQLQKEDLGHFVSKHSLYLAELNKLSKSWFLSSKADFLVKVSG